MCVWGGGRRVNLGQCQHCDVSPSPLALIAGARGLGNILGALGPPPHGGNARQQLGLSPLWGPKLLPGAHGYATVECRYRDYEHAPLPKGVVQDIIFPRDGESRAPPCPRVGK
jgi:hypothetical protein